MAPFTTSRWLASGHHLGISLMVFGADKEDLYINLAFMVAQALGM